MLQTRQAEPVKKTPPPCTVDILWAIPVLRLPRMWEVGVQPPCLSYGILIAAQLPGAHTVTGVEDGDYIDRTIGITPKRPDPALLFHKDNWIRVHESLSATTGQ